MKKVTYYLEINPNTGLPIMEKSAPADTSKVCSAFIIAENGSPTDGMFNEGVDKENFIDVVPPEEAPLQLQPA